MKSKITLILFLLLITQIKSYAQYEMIDMMRQMQNQMYQQNLQRVYSQIETNYSYKCFDGENISCIITMARMTGFPDASAIIQNRERTESKKLTIDRYNPLVITITIGEPDWKLNYGDRVTITYDGNSTKTLDIGNMENMSEVDWKRYTERLIDEAKQQVKSHSANNADAYPVVLPDANSGSNNINQYSTKQKCGYCEGTGKCPLCNSVGQSKACVQNRFGVTCSDTYCIAKNHRCKECGGTHICQNCKGTKVK